MGSKFSLAPVFLAVVLKIILTTNLEVTVDRVERYFFKTERSRKFIIRHTVVVMVAKAVTLFWEKHHSAGSIRGNHSRAALLTQTHFAGGV